MASDWAFEELGPRAFEQLAVALAAKLLGPHIEVFGSGKDGGREATYTGTIVWTEDTGSIPTDRRWTGYTVVQAKQRERVGPPAQDLAWLKSQIGAEFNDWASGRRAKLPDNLLFVTNARLSAEDTVGGIDQITRYIDTKLNEDRTNGAGEKTRSLHDRGLRNVNVWHRDTLNALVSAHSDIRDAFPSLLTVGDLLTRLTMLSSGALDPQRVSSFLVDHAQSTLRHEQWLRFDEAGDTPDARHQIDNAIVDLPAECDGSRMTSMLTEIVQRADQVTRKSLWHFGAPRHLVITGAPGNGKSTVAQYITQVYRANFVRHEANQTTIIDLVGRTDRSLERIGVVGPRSVRWPLRVDLAKMANDMGPSGGPNIKRWLADAVTKSTEMSIEPITLSNWMKAWPTLLIFDGYDEVTMPQHRDRVVDEIGELLDWADANDSDLLMVITTRRTGYTEQLFPEHFKQIDLGDFTIEEAVRYAHHITSQRLSDDAPHRERVLDRFGQAIKNPAIERLLKTPLQVLIMTIILGGSTSLPTTRYQLFWTYFETVYKREASKFTANRTFFRDHRAAIIELHQIVGLILQIRCETTDEVVARMPRAELSDLAEKYMLGDGHDKDSASAFANRIFDVATQRLVLLTADEDDTVSFDVRSLQELMAGSRLVDQDDELTRANLQRTALSPHWRNAWLFGAGKLALDNRHRRDLLLEVVEHCDESSDWPSWLCPAGPELAAYLLQDGLVADRPNDQKRLIHVALRCLQGPLLQEPRTVAVALQNTAARNKLDSAHIRNEMSRAQAATGERKAIAQILMHHGHYGSARIPGSYSDEDLRRAVNMWIFRRSSDSRGVETVTVAELIRPAFDELSSVLEPPDALLAEDAMADLAALKLTRTRRGDLWPVTDTLNTQAPGLESALGSAAAADLLKACLDALDHSQDWAASAMVTRLAAAKYSRRPVGHLIPIMSE
ncbi:NACHT domain-containing protein [Gordonia liuliyuniae]|uniref:AAA+ ATPase domain-containing protein n=1 Tax=Gordonia liuliyuniae TaxID=2911517 RepID=A0ABS9IWB4_9ACTN|nr:hypothetical protein [Gordonia liuliyuniae]MCF8589850.1 hypothetical protein [Gordonia liuliyuniae]